MTGKARQGTPPRPQPSACALTGHLQQRGDDAAVADVVAGGQVAGRQQRLRGLPHAAQGGGGHVGAVVAQLVVGLWADARGSGGSGFVR